MKPIPVIACANTRLQADVMLIRLRRAGVACEKISALFPLRLIPNAIACWLPVAPERSVLLGQETIARAGVVRGRLPSRKANGHTVIDLLTDAGIDRRSANRLEEKLKRGDILLSVLAASKVEIAIAWHIFKHVAAELIVIGQARRKEKTPGALPDVPPPPSRIGHAPPIKKPSTPWLRSPYRREGALARHGPTAAI